MGTIKENYAELEDFQKIEDEKIINEYHDIIKMFHDDLLNEFYEFCKKINIPFNLEILKRYNIYEHYILRMTLNKGNIRYVYKSKWNNRLIRISAKYFLIFLRRKKEFLPLYYIIMLQYTPNEIHTESILGFEITEKYYFGHTSFICNIWERIENLVQLQ